MKKVRKKISAKADINVTPFIDILARAARDLHDDHAADAERARCGGSAAAAAGHASSATGCS